ncbi:MAG: hypothetical protein RLZ58_940 [Pseudomonadota bacterium]
MAKVAEQAELLWTWARLEALSPLDVYDLLALRSEVFVVEQACVFQDADGVDRQAFHLLGRDTAGRLLSCLRVVDAGAKYHEPSIGRVITAPEARRTGLGRVLMAQGLLRCMQVWPGRAVRISAQARLERFYRDFGFVAQGAPYMEDGIPHLEMLRAPT